MKSDMEKAVAAALAVLSEMQGHYLTDSEFSYYEKRIREILLSGLDKLNNL